jgi:cytosine/adenosine deaminase-related metal-dependent hydrolase
MRIHRLPVILAAIILFFATSTSAALTSLVFTHANVINVKTGGVLPNATIVIQNDRIIIVSQDANIPADAQVVDVHGQFVIPGLWDMHAHPLYTADRPERMFRLLLANGVTGVRDLGSLLPVPDALAWRDKVNSGAVLGPRMIAAGKIVDGPIPVFPNSIPVETADQGREIVQTLRKQGVDLIKVYSRLPREAYFAIAAEAKKEGIPFVGHTPIFISAHEAATAGQRSIEHLSELLFACSSHESELRKQLTTSAIGAERDRLRREQTKVMVDTFSEEKALQLAKLFRENDTWQVPTLNVQYTYAYVDPYALHDFPGTRYVPPEMVDGWIGRVAGFRKIRNEQDMAAQRRSYELEIHLVRIMHKAGVHFMTGTDAETFYPAGFCLHMELALFVSAGFSPLETLQAATLNPAEYMGRTKDLGTVEAGKLADLVILEANPLEQIQNATRIAGVVTAGRYLDREKLNQMLSEAADLARNSSAQQK